MPRVLQQRLETIAALSIVAIDCRVGVGWVPSYLGEGRLAICVISRRGFIINLSIDTSESLIIKLHGEIGEANWWTVIPRLGVVNIDLRAFWRLRHVWVVARGT